MAGSTGLEPAASAVTGQRSNQLNYVPTRQINEMRNRQCLCGCAIWKNGATSGAVAYKRCPHCAFQRRAKSLAGHSKDPSCHHLEPTTDNI